MTEEQIRISRLTRVMRENRLKFNKRFERVVDHGFSDVASESFFGEVVDDIERILGYGINNGISGSVKKTVSALTVLAVKSGEDDLSVAKLEKLRGKRRVVLNALRMEGKERTNVHLIKNLDGYIDSTLEGMKYLKELNPRSDLAALTNVRKCKALLEETKQLLGGVIDRCSENALISYNTALSALHESRRQLARSNGFYDSRLIERLSTVRDTVKGWSKQYLAVKGKPKEKVYQLPFDDMDRLLKSRELVADIGLFLRDCDRFSEKITKRYDNPTREAVKKLQARLDEIGAKEQAVVASYRNGEITAEQAEEALEPLTQERETVEFEMERLEDQWAPSAEIARMRKLLLCVERPIRRTYNYIQENPLQIYAVFSELPFGEIIAALNNNLSEQEFEEAVHHLMELLIARGVMEDARAKELETLERGLAAAEQVKSGVQKPREKTTSRLDTLLNREQSNTEEELVYEEDPVFGEALSVSNGERRRERA